MIDLVDKKLVELLEKDASQTSRSLAENLGVDSSTIRRRVNKLIKEDIIRISAVPDTDKIGFHFVAVIAFDVEHENLEPILDYLSKFQEVKWLSSTTGRFDAMAIVWFASSSEYYNFVQKELAKLEGIKDIETFICLQVKKKRGMLTGK